MLSNKPRGGNKQRDSTELVKRQRKSLFDKAYLNIVRALGVRSRRVGASIRKSDKIAGDPKIQVDKRQDDKVVRVLGQTQRGKNYMKDLK